MCNTSTPDPLDPLPCALYPRPSLLKGPPRAEACFLSSQCMPVNAPSTGVRERACAGFTLSQSQILKLLLLLLLRVRL